MTCNSQIDSACVNFAHSAPYPLGSVGNRLAQEIWVTDAPFYADPTGATDAASAFQAAINALPASGGVVRFRGTFRIDSPLDLPTDPKSVELRGASIDSTKLLQGTADTPLVRKIPGVSRITGARLTGFMVVAHENSDKGDPANVLIDIAGFNDSEVSVGYESHSAATPVSGCAYAVVAGHANVGSCYNNRIRLRMQATAGPGKGVWLHNGGAGTPLANANCNQVSVWVYALSNLGVAVDGGDTTQMTVHSSIIEDCPGAVGIIAGNFTRTRGNWIELLETSIRYGVTADTVANNCTSSHDQFSGTNKIVIHSAIAGPPRFNDALFGAVAFKNENNVDTLNYIVPTLAKFQPSFPTLSFILGGGPLVPDDASIRHRVDHHGITTGYMRVLVTPAAVGRSVFRCTVPTGFEIEQVNVSVVELEVAAPLAVAINNASGNEYEIWFPNTNSHVLTIRFTLRALQ